MRLRRLIPAFLAICAITAQTPRIDIEEMQAEARDEALLEVLLHRPISTKDVYQSPRLQNDLEKEAEDLLAAAQRRVSRAEQRIEVARMAGATAETLKPMFAEVQKRIEMLNVAIFRSSALKDMVRVARAEKLWTKRRFGPRVEKFEGSGVFSAVDFKVVSRAFLEKFRRMMPLSAVGATAAHRAMGFDHRGRVDVAISPDSREGVWLRTYLETLGIPYYAFRTAVTGSATAPHIHIGPGSTRVQTMRPKSTPRSSD